MNFLIPLFRKCCCLYTYSFIRFESSRIIPLPAILTERCNVLYGALIYLRHSRSLSNSAVYLKRDKYSLDFLPIHRKGGRSVKARQKKGGTGALFTLERSEFWDFRDPSKETAKMAMIACALQTAIRNMLLSNSVPEEIHKQPIDVVKVHMSPSLNAATVYWKLDVIPENPVREALVGDMLESNLQHLQYDLRDTAGTRIIVPEYF